MSVVVYPKSLASLTILVRDPVNSSFFACYVGTGGHGNVDVYEFLEIRGKLSAASCINPHEIQEDLPGDISTSIEYLNAMEGDV